MSITYTELIGTCQKIARRNTELEGLLAQYEAEMGELAGRIQIGRGRTTRLAETLLWLLGDSKTLRASIDEEPFLDNHHPLVALIAYQESANALIDACTRHTLAKTTLKWKPTEPSRRASRPVTFLPISDLVAEVRRSSSDLGSSDGLSLSSMSISGPDPSDNTTEDSGSD